MFSVSATTIWIICLCSLLFSSRIKENLGIVEFVWYVAEKVVSEKE